MVIPFSYSTIHGNMPSFSGRPSWGCCAEVRSSGLRRGPFWWGGRLGRPRWGLTRLCRKKEGTWWGMVTNGGRGWMLNVEADEFDDFIDFSSDCSDLDAETSLVFFDSESWNSCSKLAQRCGCSYDVKLNLPQQICELSPGVRNCDEPIIRGCEILLIIDSIIVVMW